MKVDPFRAASLRERLSQAAILALLAIVLLAILYVRLRTDVSDGQPLEAEVVRLGMRSVPAGMGGDAPNRTVRLPDGSVRDVPTTWSAASNCNIGSKVSLLRRGTAVQVGLRGCQPKR